MSSHSDRDSVNPQEQSPLFDLMPAEVRNQIFDLVFRAYDDKTHPYPQDAYYYRPKFRYAHRIDTAFLRTCRRAYSETRNLPSSLNSHVEWHDRSRGPSVWTAEQSSPRCATSVHLFMQQDCLLSWDQHAYRLTQEFDHLKELKITIRHSDWRDWGSGDDALKLDPNSSGYGSQPYNVYSPLVPNGAWGRSFYYFEGLERFVLELETRVGKKKELNAVVASAKEWRFGLGDGSSLVLDPRKTKKTGWIGRPFPARRQFPVDPVAAKRELMASGVDFRTEDGEPEFEGSADECSVYYVVTLTYCSQRVQVPKRRGRGKAYHETKEAYDRLFESGSA